MDTAPPITIDPTSSVGSRVPAAPYLFSTREYARLLVLRSRFRDGWTDREDVGGAQPAAGASASRPPARCPHPPDRQDAHHVSEAFVLPRSIELLSSLGAQAGNR
jgi:hypothetical protein